MARKKAPVVEVAEFVVPQPNADNEVLEPVLDDVPDKVEQDISFEGSDPDAVFLAREERVKSYR